MNTLDEILSTNQYIDYCNTEFQKVPSDNEFYYFYKYLNFQNGLGVLGVIDDCTLKYTNPIFFNDPYDCMYSMELDFSDFTKSKCEEQYNQKIKTSDWFKIKEKIKAQLKTSVDEKIMQNIRENFSITCFSTDPLNILMWSHYAHNHTGFLVEFKHPKRLLNNALLDSGSIPLPVIYTNNFPKINVNWNVEKIYSSQKHMFEFTSKMVLHKASCWEYEKEFRLVSDKQPNPENNLILSPYSPGCLSSIIFGSRISELHKKAIRQSILAFNKKFDSNVLCYQSNLKKNKYELEVPNHPML